MYLQALHRQRRKILPVSLQAIPEGIAGIRVTLKEMRRLAREAIRDPAFVQFARAMVQGQAQKNWLAQVAVIHQFVRDSIQYVRDPIGLEWVQTPQATLQVRQGDCDDKVTLTAALLRALGHPSRFVVVAFQPGRYSHVYLETRVNRRWLPVETTEPWELGRGPVNTVGPPIIKDV